MLALSIPSKPTWKSLVTAFNGELNWTCGTYRAMCIKWRRRHDDVAHILKYWTTFNIATPTVRVTLLLVVKPSASLLCVNSSNSNYLENIVFWQHMMIRKIQCILVIITSRTSVVSSARTRRLSTPLSRALIVVYRRICIHCLLCGWDETICKADCDYFKVTTHMHLYHI